MRNLFGGKAASALPLFLAPAMLIWGLYAASHQAEVLDGLQLRLRTINSIKADQIRNWLEDHSREATRLSGHPVFGGVLAEETANPGSRRKALDTWLKQHLINNEYVSLAFLTPSGRQIAATPDYQPDNEQFFRESFDASVKSCRGRLTDLYVNLSGRPRIAMLIPMSRTGTCAGGTVGVLVINIDPGARLFPILTDETALLAGVRMHIARRENGDAVILNTGADFLRRPLTDVNLCVAAALQGHTAFREGMGEDGLKVYALAEQIAGSSWTLVTEIKKGDALRQSRASEYLALLGLLFLAMLAHGLFAAVLRAREALAEAQVRDGERRMAALLSTLPGCAFRCLNDSDWTPVFLSPGFEAITGYPPDEFLAKKLSFGGMIVPEDRERVWKTVQEAVARDGRVSVTYTITTRDGLRRTVFSQAVVARDAGGEKTAFDGYLSDITPLKKAEEALRSSEAKFRQLTEKAPIGIFILQDGKFVYANPETERMFGYDRDEVVGRLGPEALIHAADLAVLSRRVAERLVGKPQDEDVVYRGLRKDGSRIFVDVASIPIEYQGRPAVMGTVTDITRRKLTEEALRESERKLKLTIDEAPVGVAMVGADGRFMQANRAWCDFLGYTAEELRGRSMQEIAYPDDAGAGMAELAELVDGKLQSMTVQKRYVRKDGAVVWGQIHSKVVRDELGRPLYILPILQDITARKKAEEESSELDAALRESEAIFAGFMEHSPVYIFFKDEEFRPVRMSRNFERLLGRPLEEALGRKMEELFPPEAAAEMLARDRKVFESGAEEVVEQRFGDSVFQTIEFPIDVAGQRYLAGYSIDITERKRAEQAEQKLVASLAEKTREMESVLYITTHDLRGPLVNVQGFSGNLGRYFEAMKGALKAEPGPEAELALVKVPEALSFINESAMRMDNLIRALLKVSRLGRTEMRPETLDVDRIVAKVIDSMRFRLLEGGGEISAAPLPRCFADPSSVDQIFGNLLDNALKYRSKDRPLSVKIGGETRGGAVVYSVADNGAGMAAADQPRIWDIFFRARGSGAAGEGIGLTMTRTLVEKNGGRIRVESEEGEGTTFYVEFPTERLG